jgi:RHS repeat-associated protein
MVSASDPAFANTYAYTGREWDKEIGLYYYRARFYDPMEGRFISRDPIGFAGGDVNVYRYVQNEPINFVDPDGKFATLPVALFIATVGGSIVTISKVVGFFQDNYYDSQLLRQIQDQEDWVIEQMKKTDCDDIKRYDYLNYELERIKGEERKIMVRLGYGVVSESHKNVFKVRKFMGE